MVVVRARLLVTMAEKRYYLRGEGKLEVFAILVLNKNTYKIVNKTIPIHLKYKYQLGYLCGLVWQEFLLFNFLSAFPAFTPLPSKKFVFNKRQTFALFLTLTMHSN